MAQKQKLQGDPKRQYRLLENPGMRVSWEDVPDALIVELVRAYTRAGDAVLFGTSKAQDVLALRVYRDGEGYSTYSRDLAGLGEAVDRMYRYRPVRKRQAQPGAAPASEAQGIRILDLPFHPLWSRESLIKQRLDAIERGKEWNRMVESIPRHFYTVAIPG